jgi:hypothetical protein
MKSLFSDGHPFRPSLKKQAASMSWQMTGRDFYGAYVTPEVDSSWPGTPLDAQEENHIPANRYEGGPILDVFFGRHLRPLFGNFRVWEKSS